MKIAIVGAGIFGVTAALELRRRGHDVVLTDTGTIPHALAASTDISKVVRIDYGADDAYTAWMDEALFAWRAWNRAFSEDDGPGPLFHETGVTFLACAPMSAGGFEYESRAAMARRGHVVETLDSAGIAARFPAWNARTFTSGYFNPIGGWAESGRVVVELARQARACGVVVREGAHVERIVAPSNGVTGGAGDVRGIALAGGEILEADGVVVACGSWVPALVPSIAASFRTVGQPVFHLAPPRAERFEAERFPVFGADIARSGWYGFPLHPSSRVVKVANHGAGRAMPPESPLRVVTAEEERAMRVFFADAIPELADAPLAGSRVCVYCDTLDGHFWIAASPGHPNLVVATGGSGHAFKFAPLLGPWIADAFEGHAPARFRWRPEIGASHEEAARARDV